MLRSLSRFNQPPGRSALQCMAALCQPKDYQPSRTCADAQVSALQHSFVAIEGALDGQSKMRCLCRVPKAQLSQLCSTASGTPLQGAAAPQSNPPWNVIVWDQLNAQAQVRAGNRPQLTVQASALRKLADLEHLFR